MLQVYNDLLREANEPPRPTMFSFRGRDGSLVERTLAPHQLTLETNAPIGRPLMDMIFEILTASGPTRVLSMPSMRVDREPAFEWICNNAPPPEWCGLRMIPLAGPLGWSLLLALHSAPGADV